MSDVLGYIAGAVVLAGSAFSLLAALGVLRLPDVYTRLHAASKAGVVGAGLIFAAVAVAAADLPIAVRAIFGIFFLLLTTPVSAHLLARAAYLKGFRTSHITNTNDIDKKWE